MIRIYDDSIKHCHYHQQPKRYTPYSSHYGYINDKKSKQCTSVICDDMNKGMTIEQVWKKEYNYGKQTKIEIKGDEDGR